MSLLALMLGTLRGLSKCVQAFPLMTTNRLHHHTFPLGVDQWKEAMSKPIETVRYCKSRDGCEVNTPPRGVSLATCARSMPTSSTGQGACSCYCFSNLFSQPPVPSVVTRGSRLSFHAGNLSLTHAATPSPEHTSIQGF